MLACAKPARPITVRMPMTEPATSSFGNNHGFKNMDKSIVHFWFIQKLFIAPPDSLAVQDRKYQKKKAVVEKFIKKSGKIDNSIILNNVDVDYDTLMKILSDLRNEGRIA